MVANFRGWLPIHKKRKYKTTWKLKHMRYVFDVESSTVGGGGAVNILFTIQYMDNILCLHFSIRSAIYVHPHNAVGILTFELP